MLVIWNERARPLRARRAAGRRVMSSPPKAMRPESGRRLPASWPMKVVLPAPFGPMTACVSPSATSKSMPSLARRAPKVLVSWRTSSIFLLEDAGQAAAEEYYGEHQQRSEHYHPVLGPCLEDFLQYQQAEGADHRAAGGGHAAEDHHEHQLARLVPAHQAGGDVAGVVGVQRARQAAQRAGHDERGEAQDRKSTRLNSSHSQISYAVFC